MRSDRCEKCGEEVGVSFSNTPVLCEDCRPETGPGSRILAQFSVNLQRLRLGAGIKRKELAHRAAVAVSDVEKLEGEPTSEPGTMRALRLAHSLEASIDQLTERVFWNPGEVAARPAERRPDSERLAGFFLVLPENVPIFESKPRVLVANGLEAAEIVGGNVREARTRRHLTQEALASIAGLSKSGLSLIERGIHETTVATLLSVAWALEVPPGLLLDGISWVATEGAVHSASKKGDGARRCSPYEFDDAVCDLWEENLPASEIARRLGTTPGDVSAIVYRLREQGLELAYRQPAATPAQASARHRRCDQKPSLVARPELIHPDAVERQTETESSGRVRARIGLNVAFHRRRTGLNRRHVAEAAETSEGLLRQLEDGKTNPSLSLLLKVAGALNVRCGLLTAGIGWMPAAAEFEVR